MRTTTRLRDGLLAVLAESQWRDELERLVDSARRAGTLVGSEGPELVDAGLWQVRVVIRRVPAGGQALATPPPGPGPGAEPGPVWSPPAWLTGQVAGRAATVAGVGGLLVAVVWVVARAVAGAVAWTGEHAGQIVALLGLAGVGAAVWAVRKLRRGRGQASGCVTQHGPRCRSH
jgi:hypothetical protein